MASGGIFSLLSAGLGLLSQPDTPEAPTPVAPPPPPPEPPPERGVDPDQVLSEEAAKNRELQRRKTNYRPSLMTKNSKKTLLGE